MQLLIIKLGSIGDIVHTLPSLAAIRREVPNAHISWVVESRSAEILRGNRLIDSLIEVDTRSLRGGRVIEEMLLGAGRQLKDLRARSYDLSIDFQGLWKSAMIGKLSGAKRRFGFASEGLREPASRILLTGQVQVAAGLHVIRKNLKLAAESLGFQVSDDHLDFPIATESEHVEEADSIIRTLGSSRFAILNPAGGWVTKLWHPEKFGELADRIWEEHRMPSLVVNGPGESHLAELVAAASRLGRIALAEPSLKGFYEIARQAAVYVGGDTGPTHLAVAAGTPIVGIFGPTEWWRNGSPRNEDIVVERQDIGCRVECHRRTCSNWICMDTDVETVSAAVNQRLMTVGASLVG